MPIIGKQLEFGHGDIEVYAGTLQHEDNVGVVAFGEKEKPTPIGTRTDYEEGHTVEPSETPIRMLFTKVESIDVVIRGLQTAKELMLSKQEG